MVGSVGRGGGGRKKLFGVRVGKGRGFYMDKM